MTHFTRLATSLLIIVGASALVVPVPAQTPPTLDNKQIEIAYVVPSNPNYRPIYDYFRKRRVLEQLKAFLAPLRLPENERLKVRITDVERCEGNLPNAFFYASDRTVTICYQYIDWYRRIAPRETTPEGLKPQDAIVASFLDVLFHELGHAVFYLYQVPIFGREEDAADQIAAYLLTQFGQDVARRTLLGIAHFNEKIGDVPTKMAFADEHSTAWQRFYTNLCIAYGAHPDAFKDLIEKGLLPQTRAMGCAREYRQVAYAFKQHLLPHIDQDLMKQVKAIEWLKSDDGACVIERC